MSKRWKHPCEGGKGLVMLVERGGDIKIGKCIMRG